MSYEMDLIPASYRERLKIQRWCHFFLMIFLSICLLIVIASFSIVNKTDEIKLTITSLQKDRSFNLQQQQKYNELLGTKKELEKNLEILAGLRGGPSVRQMFKVIDRVMNGSVWFNEWLFQRAGEMIEIKDQTQQTGYFILIPQTENRPDIQQAWKMNTHMEIKGSAKDHSSFSSFVSQLINQPEIEDVKVINTFLGTHAKFQMVNFQIIVIVNDQFQISRV